MKNLPQRTTIALLGSSLGGLLAYALGELLGYSEGLMSVLPTVLIVSIMAIFTFDRKGGESLNWWVYGGKCVLFAFLLATFLSASHAYM